MAVPFAPGTTRPKPTAGTYGSAGHSALEMTGSRARAYPTVKHCRDGCGGDQYEFDLGCERVEQRIDHCVGNQVEPFDSPDRCIDELNRTHLAQPAPPRRDPALRPRGHWWRSAVRC